MLDDVIPELLVSVPSQPTPAQLSMPVLGIRCLTETGHQTAIITTARGLACPAHRKAIAALLDDLTKLAFQHPETHARLIYELA